MNLISQTEHNLRSIPGYGQLTRWDKALLRSFAVAWPLFEERCLNRRANAASIADFSEQQGNAPVPSSIHRAFAYFKNRYFEGQFCVERFHALCHGRVGDEPQQGVGIQGTLEELFNADDPDLKATVQAVLLTIYRLRNNLLHGNKYDGIANQRENFSHSLRVINALIERE